jgi:hypothetical protein
MSRQQITLLLTEALAGLQLVVTGQERRLLAVPVHPEHVCLDDGEAHANAQRAHSGRIGVHAHLPAEP